MDDTNRILQLEEADPSYDDGNLIVIANKVYHRVHRSVLRNKSELFKDMLTLPQPVTEEKMNGLPVVRLTDSAEEVTFLLDAVYNGLRHLQQRDVPSWEDIKKALSLGTKYQLNSMRKEALRYLDYWYPNTIGQWDEVEDDTSDHAISVVNVARSFNLREIHLRALYQCCSLDVEVLVNGHISDSGVRDKLCSEDLIACLKGREKLLFARRRIHEAFSRDRLHQIVAQASCQFRGQKLSSCSFKLPATFLVIENEATEETYDPLAYDYRIKTTALNVGICRECTDAFCRHHLRLRQEILDKLDTFLEVPSMIP